MQSPSQKDEAVLIIHQAPPDISLRLFPHLILAKRPRNDRLFPKALIAWLLPT